MATLAPASLKANLWRSLNAFIHTNVQTALSVQVLYPYAPRIPELGVRWIDAHYMELAQLVPYERTRDGWAGLSQYLVNLNVFEQEDGAGVTLYSLTELVDSVSQVFAYGVVVPVYNYAPLVNVLVGGLEVREKPGLTDVPTPPERAVRQVNISVPMVYEDRVVEPVTP